MRDSASLVKGRGTAVGGGGSLLPINAKRKVENAKYKGRRVGVPYFFGVKTPQSTSLTAPLSGEPSAPLYYYKIIQRSPLQPSLITRSNVSWNFIRASVGIW